MVQKISYFPLFLAKNWVQYTNLFSYIYMYNYVYTFNQYMLVDVDRYTFDHHMFDDIDNYMFDDIYICIQYIM